MTTCIINVSIDPPGSNIYSKGQDRLNASLDRVGFRGDRLMWRHCYPDGCPPHDKQMYLFKPYAFKAAFEKFDCVLWLDSSIVVQRPIDPVFDMIEDDRYFLISNPGWSSGQWSHPRQLEALGIGLEESFKIPHLLTGVVGFNRAWPGMDEWKRLGDAGMFHFRRDRIEGCDPRVKGNRNEQTILSYLTYRSHRWMPFSKWIKYDGTDGPNDTTFLVRSLV